MQNEKKRIRPLRLIFICLALAFLALELVIRAGWIPGYKPAELRPSFEAIQETAQSKEHPYLAYALKPDFSTDNGRPYKLSTHNSAGFRGPEVSVAKPEGTYRILCLGGSSTFGVSPNTDADTWPARLEHHLATELSAEAQGRTIEVLNFGVFGYSTFESLINLSLRGVDYEPDLVLVYHTINDVRCALYNRGGPLQRDNAHWRAVWAKVMPSPAESFMEKSLVYCAFRKRFTNYLLRFEKLDAFAVVNYDPFAQDAYAGEIQDLGFQSFRRNLESIIAVARAHGAKVMLVSQGCDRKDIQGSSREEELAAMDRMGEILRATANDLGTHFCDARPALEEAASKVPAEVLALEKTSQALLAPDKSAAEHEEGIEAWMRFSRESIFTGDVHMTDRGADFLAQTIAKTIRAANLL